jgi:sugar phosphate isomerase/epimerase
MITRRLFGAAALGLGLAGASNPLLAQTPAPSRVPVGASTFSGLTIGCNSGTFALMPADDAVQGMVACGFTTAELHPKQVEPNFNSPRVGRGETPTADQQKVAAYAREAIRQWRLSVPMEFYAMTAKKFSDAGIRLMAFNMNYRDDFTDAELDRSFEMAKALDVDLISAVGSVAVFRRLDPMAQRHKIRIGMHNEVNIPDVAGFEAASEGLSDYSGYTLDIGHFTATGGDSMAMLKKHGSRIFNMHIKDRVKNLGPTVPFGQGDTRIVEILRWMRDNNIHTPTNVEQEAPGWDRLKLAQQAIDYCRMALT